MTPSTPQHQELILLCSGRYLYLVLQLNGRDILFIINSTYFGITFDTRMTCRHHIESTAAKALGMYIRTYSLFKIGPSIKNIKLTLYALTRSVITYACPTWEYAAGAHILKLQRLQNRALSATGVSDRAHQSANCTCLS
jgi:hypothetical protein